MRAIRRMIGGALAGRALLALLSLGAASLASPAHAGPGDLQYATITNHNPSGFLRALRAGADFVRGGGGRKFRIILGGGGAIIAIPGTSIAQRDYVKIHVAAVQVIACKETIDALSKANRRRIPVLPGVILMPCAGLRNKMTVAGWQPAPGF